MQARSPVILIIAVLLLALPSWGQDRLVTQPVSDWVGVLDAATQRRLEGYLWELKQKTAAELAIAIIPTTEGIPIEDFALALAERSGLGARGRDNGCLVLVATQDRKYRIEVGYGLEGILPDGFVGGIGRQYFVPYFKAGDYAGGIEQGVLALAHQIATDSGVTLTGVPTPRQPSGPGRQRSSRLWVFLIIFLVIMARIVSPIGRRFSRGSLWYLLLLGWLNTTSGRRRYGGWSSSGGFSSGGGFGSFGGGGGGFGGGGASGSW